jgi:hypothetical protein
MQVAACPVVVGSSALIVSSLIATTPVASPPDLHTVSAAVRLLSTDPLGGLENIPYNLFADLANVPYNDALAVQEIVYALGPPDTTGGVPGWIAPGTPDSAISATDQYMLGGTGSWWMESLGNTWGWDDGNWPQVVGYLMAVLPFPQFTLPLAQQLQELAQAEIVDGAGVNCEFECSNATGYIGGWFQTPIQDLLNPNGYTYPTVLQGNVGVDGQSTDVIWSGQQVPQLDLSAPGTDFFNSLLAPPADNPIEPVDLANVINNYSMFWQETDNDWGGALATGSFLYFGAPTLYSIPNVIGGEIQDFTGIPNQWGFPTDQPYGAEPDWGPTAGPAQLLSGLEQGLQYLLSGPGGPADGPDGTGGGGLLGYLDPSTLSAALNTDFSNLFGSFDPSTLSADLSGLLGPDLASMVASLF